MNSNFPDPSNALLANLPTLLPKLEALYKDIHSHPELSMQEMRTADLASKHLRDNVYDVTTGVGKTGVVGLLKNGEGPTVMLRADMDALPVREASGVSYASTAMATDADGNNPDLDNYFITADPAEQAFVDTGAVGRWLRTGLKFKSGGATQVCRFYGNTNTNPTTGLIYGPTATSIQSVKPSATF